LLNLGLLRHSQEKVQAEQAGATPAAGIVSGKIKLRGNTLGAANSVVEFSTKEKPEVYKKNGLRHQSVERMRQGKDLLVPTGAL
jgi:hypothetical protein